MPPVPSRPECFYVRLGDDKGSDEARDLIGRAVAGEFNVIAVREPLADDATTYFFVPYRRPIEHELVDVPIRAHTDGIFTTRAVAPTVAMANGEVMDPTFFNDITQLGKEHGS